MSQEESPMRKVKFYYGHTVEFHQGGAIFVVDDSGDRGEVDRDKPIRARDIFSIPLKGGFSTVAGAEEAFEIAHRGKMPILAGDVWYTVTPV